MTNREFTLAEASALLPTLQELMSTVIELRVALKFQYQRLDALNHPPGETLPWGAPIEAVNAHATYHGLAETLHEHVATIRNTGAIIRDIETGLVDFRARIPSSPEPVWWSWRLGERYIDRIRFAHDAADRRALTELPPELLLEAADGVIPQHAGSIEVIDFVGEKIRLGVRP